MLTPITRYSLYVNEGGDQYGNQEDYDLFYRSPITAHVARLRRILTTTHKVGKVERHDWLTCPRGALYCQTCKLSVWDCTC